MNFKQRAKYFWIRWGELLGFWIYFAAVILSFLYLPWYVAVIVLFFGSMAFGVWGIWLRPEVITYIRSVVEINVPLQTRSVIAQRIVIHIERFYNKALNNQMLRMQLMDEYQQEKNKKNGTEKKEEQEN